MHNKFFFHSLNLLLALMIIAALLSILTPPPHSSSVNFNPPTSESFTTATEDPLKTLLDAHLFGAKPSEQIKPPALQAPATTLRLKLKGVMMTEATSDSFAIVSAPNVPDRSYGLNDILPGNARITHIFTDRIILENGNRQESLRLTLPIGSQPKLAKKVNQKTAVTHRATISGFRDQFIKNPSVLGDILSAEPVTLASGHSGWQISPGGNATLFNQLGLKPGDLVMAINGVSAEHRLSRIALLNELATADQLNLKILRKEKVLSFYFTMTN